MSNFDKFWEDYKLQNIMSQAKTLSKSECETVYDYMDRYRPGKILEFGVQLGCSSRLFIDAAKSLNYRMQLHSWDVIKAHKLVKEEEFIFHKKDITGKEGAVFKNYSPDLVFLDAHVYHLTKNF